MSDPCQCLFDHEAAMRRLLSLLRDSQSECTDGDCTTGGGMFSGPQGMVMWSMLWGLLALALFFMRPRSLRAGPSDPAEKRPPSGGDGGDNNQPPPPGVL